MNWKEFHFKKGSKTQVWKIAIADNGVEYMTQHGQLGGKMQEFSDRPGSKGKPGTESFVDEQFNTLFHVSREIRKKEEHGYVEVDNNGQPMKCQITEIDWYQLLPKNFCGYKPQTDISEKKLKDLHSKGLAKYSRKYDGHCHYAAHHPWGWVFYSRRIDVASERFVNHILELDKLKHFGPGTLISGEMTSFNSNGTDNFKNVSRVCRSLPEEARRLITSKEVPEPKFIIYDVLYHNYKSLENQSYDERSKLWMGLSPPNTDKNTLIHRVEYFNITPLSWRNLAKDKGWEGFVVADGSSIPGNKFFNFSGKPERPLGHYKLKPLYTEDVVVYGAVTGTGKYQGKVGALLIKQLWPEGHSNYDTFFDCGKVGSGLNDESRALLEVELKKIGIPIFDDEKSLNKQLLNEQNGLCIEIEYAARQPGTQKFKYPVFTRIRHDKSIDECYAQNLAEDGDEE